MKKTYLLFLYNGIIIFSYIALIVLSTLGYIFPFYKSWFSYALIFLSLLVLPRFILFNVDTNLWAFNLLFLCGFFGVLKSYFKLNTMYSVCGYIICVSVSSFLMFVFFRQIFHFKLFTFLFLSAIILIVYECNFINFWLTISLLSIIAGIFVISLTKTILRNMRKVWNLKFKRMVITQKKLMNT